MRQRYFCSQDSSGERYVRQLGACAKIIIQLNADIGTWTPTKPVPSPCGKEGFPQEGHQDVKLCFNITMVRRNHRERNTARAFPTSDAHASRSVPVKKYESGHIECSYHDWEIQGSCGHDGKKAYRDPLCVRDGMERIKSQRVGRSIQTLLQWDSVKLEWSWYRSSQETYKWSTRSEENQRSCNADEIGLWGAMPHHRFLLCPIGGPPTARKAWFQGMFVRHHKGNHRWTLDSVWWLQWRHTTGQLRLPSSSWGK